MTNKCSTLGLCKRAGKLLSGFDAVKDELNNPKTKAAGIILAADVSEKTEKEVRFYADKRRINVVRITDTMDDIAAVLNKRTGVFAILDAGFFASLGG